MERGPDGRFELRVLGPADLRDPDGREVPAVLVQPKRLALLCYLAQASPHGLHRRDELLALLWPERSQARARHALSQSLHFLRQRLGQEAITARGSDEVGLNPARVWCDAVRFDQALAEGAIEEALALYRGEFLDAFFVSEALGFERWLDTERARLRSNALEAALQLSDAAARAADPRGAVHWARWAVSRVPEDEAAERCLAKSLDASGDRAGAVQALERYVRWLNEELSAEPASETRVLLRFLHRSDPDTRSDGRGPPSPFVPLATTMPPRPRAPPVMQAQLMTAPATPVRPRSLRGPSRAGFGAVAGLFFVLLGVGMAYQRFGVAAPDGAGSRDASTPERTVAVLPFGFHGNDGTSYLPGAVAELLCSGLDGAAGIQTIDPRATARLAASSATNGTPTRLEREVRSGFGAGSFIAGSITETHDWIRLNATWYGRGGRRLAGATVEGPTTELFTLVDRLAAELVAGVHPEQSGQLIRSAARTTTSLAALKPFIDGERQLREGRYPPAVASFRRAVAADTAFALAHYRLSIAAEYVGDAQLAYDAAVAAVRHADRLQPTDRALLDALLAARRGDAERAEFLYRQTVTIDPFNVEAWLQLGEVQFHYGPVSGRPVRESKRAWEAVLDLEPDNIAARYHLARILAAEGDRRALSRLTAATAAISPRHERVAAMRAMESMGAGDAAVDRVAVQLQALDDATLYMAVFDAMTFGGNPRAASSLARVLTQAARPPDMRAWGHLWLSHLELASGRWRAAQNELDRLEELDPVAAIEYRAVLALHPLLGPGTVDVQGIRQSLRGPRGIRTPATSEDFPSAIHAELRPHLHAYLLALLEARWGDPSHLDPAAAAIEEAALPGSAAALLPASLRAFSAALAGDPERASEWLKEGMCSQWYEMGRWSAFFGQCQDRWLMAGIEDRLGRPREALRRYEAVTQTSPLDVLFLAPAALRRARIHGQLGEALEETSAYAQFVQLWHGADPELRGCLLASTDRQPGGASLHGIPTCMDWFGR
jgi:DNA-binding SARP family transcriptional activator/tetratricopeptide (TPR) repeat protein